MPKFVEPLSEARSEKNVCGALVDLSQKVYQFRLYSQCYFPMQQSNLSATHKVEYFGKWITVHGILHDSNQGAIVIKENAYSCCRFGKPGLARR